MLSPQLSVIRNEIREYVKGYYDRNDTAHKIEHADDVCDMAIKMRREFGLPDCDKELILAAYTHDMFCSVRKDHHIKAAEFVKSGTTDIYEKYLDDVGIEAVSKACLEHRASWNGGYSSIISELIASADRGAPKDTMSLYIRSYEYAIDKLGMGRNRAMRHAYIHIKRKFGFDGYAAFPDIYRKHYAADLERIRQDIKRITFSSVCDYLTKWDEEQNPNTEIEDMDYKIKSYFCCGCPSCKEAGRKIAHKLAHRYTVTQDIKRSYALMCGCRDCMLLSIFTHRRK